MASVVETTRRQSRSHAIDADLDLSVYCQHFRLYFCIACFRLLRNLTSAQYSKVWRCDYDVVCLVLSGIIIVWQPYPFILDHEAIVPSLPVLISLQQWLAIMTSSSSTTRFRRMPSVWYGT